MSAYEQLLKVPAGPDGTHPPIVLTWEEYLALDKAIDDARREQERLLGWCEQALAFKKERDEARAQRDQRNQRISEQLDQVLILGQERDEARRVAREMFPTYLNRLPGKAEALLAKHSWLGEAE